MAQDVLALTLMLAAPVSWAAVRHIRLAKMPISAPFWLTSGEKILNPMNPLAVPRLAESGSVSGSVEFQARTNVPLGTQSYFAMQATLLLVIEYQRGRTLQITPAFRTGGPSSMRHQNR